MSGAPRDLLAPAVLAIALVVAAPAARADRPLETEDAEILDKGQCKLESWGYDSSSTKRYWLVPACNPFGNLELQLGFAREWPTDEPRHDDYTLQAKTVLKPLEENGWGIALIGGAARGGGGEERTWGYSATLAVSRAFADGAARVHGNAGAVYAQRTNGLFGLWSIAGELDVTARVTLVGEVLGVAGEGRLAQAGARLWVIPDRVHINGSIGRTDAAGGTAGFFTVGIYLATRVR